MSEIKKLKDSNNENIYPVTITDAVYTSDGKKLFDVLNNFESVIQKIKEYESENEEIRQKLMEKLTSMDVEYDSNSTVPELIDKIISNNIPDNAFYILSNTKYEIDEQFYERNIPASWVDQAYMNQYYGFYMCCNSSDDYPSYIYTWLPTPIDVSEYSAVHVKLDPTNWGNYYRSHFYIYFLDTAPNGSEAISSYEPPEYADYCYINMTNYFGEEYIEMDLDISHVTGSYYICMALYVEEGDDLSTELYVEDLYFK